MPAIPAQAVRPSRGLLRRAYCCARAVMAFIGLAFILYHLCFSLSVVVSGSMAPTLKGNGDPGSDWVVSERVSYWFRQPRRWEIVQFRNNEGFVVAKRVAGLPGEVISLDDKKVVVNDEFQGEPVVVVFLPERLTAFVYDRRLRGQTLTFDWHNDQMIDRETQAVWNPATGASADPVWADERLILLPGTMSYKSAWSTFYER